MTREEAYEEFKKIDTENVKWIDFNLKYIKLLDKIYDDFEKGETNERENITNSNSHTNGYVNN
jgi:hypothetical protein